MSFQRILFPPLFNKHLFIAHILKSVLEEVEKVMKEFKGMLYKSMQDPQIDLTDLENTVTLLLKLEPDSDPVWHYSKYTESRIRGLLEKCTLDHEAKMETLHHPLHERALSYARWNQVQQDSNQSSDVDSLTLGNTNLVVESQPGDLSGEAVDALKREVYTQLTSVIIHYIPAS